MSTKKDKFSLKDKLYMDLALDLARAREGLTGTNPSVGCVIVKNGKIISIGQTSYNGRPHAETNAIRNTSENLKRSEADIKQQNINQELISKSLSEINLYLNNNINVNKDIKEEIKILSKTIANISKK